MPPCAIRSWRSARRRSAATAAGARRAPSRAAGPKVHASGRRPQARPGARVLPLACPLPGASTLPTRGPMEPMPCASACAGPSRVDLSGAPRPTPRQLRARAAHGERRADGSLTASRVTPLPSFARRAASPSWAPVPLRRRRRSRALHPGVSDPHRNLNFVREPTDPLVAPVVAAFCYHAATTSS